MKIDLAKLTRKDITRLKQIELDEAWWDKHPEGRFIIAEKRK